MGYEKGGQNFTERGPVILASGGFGADFTANSLLAQYRPDLIHLPTTNGEHCTGDAIKMGESIGANTVDLEWVQVHPTGLVKPDDADAKIKFLAAEALRGVGGLIFDAEGKRFANELGRRDYVTGEMWKNKATFRLALNKAASDEIIWHCKHYTGIMLLTFMTIHLFQFRFGDTDQFGDYMIRSPPWLINFWGIPSLTLFWTDDTTVKPVGVRDIYALEFQLFQNKLWSGFYIFSVVIFMTHACLGWKKVTPVLGIPRGHIAKVETIGYLIFVTLGAIYISFPLWCMLTAPDAGYQTAINPGRVG